MLSPTAAATVAATINMPPDVRVKFFMFCAGDPNAGLTMEEFRGYVEQYPDLITSMDSNGLTGLIWAAASAGSIPISKFLIEHKANVNHANTNGYTATLACMESRKPEVLKYLLEMKADLNCQLTKTGYTPVHFAAQHGDIGLLQLCVEHKADINKVDVNKRTPVMTALGLKQPAAAKWLVEQPDIALEDADATNMTVLDWVSHCGLEAGSPEELALREAVQAKMLPPPPAFDASFLDEPVAVPEDDAHRDHRTCPQCYGLVLTMGLKFFVHCPRCSHVIDIVATSDQDKVTFDTQGIPLLQPHETNSENHDNNNNNNNNNNNFGGTAAAVQPMAPAPAKKHKFTIGPRNIPYNFHPLPDYLKEEPADIQDGWYRNETRVANLPYEKGRCALACRGCLLACTPITNVVLSLYMMYRMYMRKRQKARWSQPEERWDIAWYDTEYARRAIILGWIIWLIWFPAFISSTQYASYFIGAFAGIFSGCCFCLVICWNADVFFRPVDSYSGASGSNNMIGGGDCWFYGCDLHMQGGSGRNQCTCDDCPACQLVGEWCDKLGDGCSSGCSHVVMGFPDCFQAVFQSCVPALGDCLGTLGDTCGNIGDSLGSCGDGCDLNCDCNCDCGSCDCGGCDCGTC